jgi:hypothetical protein
MSYITNDKASPMSEDFHDWLDQCPVQWTRESSDDESATYVFNK